MKRSVPACSVNLSSFSVEVTMGEGYDGTNTLSSRCVSSELKNYRFHLLETVSLIHTHTHTHIAYTCIPLTFFSLCIMGSRYKQHRTDFEVLSSGAPLALPCQVKGCRCTAYQYVALSGSQPARCRCKHKAEDHSEAGRHFCNMCKNYVVHGFTLHGFAFA